MDYANLPAPTRRPKPSRWPWAIRLGFLSVIVAAEAWRRHYSARFLATGDPDYDHHTRMWEYYDSIYPGIWGGMALAIGFVILAAASVPTRRPMTLVLDLTAAFGCAAWVFWMFMHQAFGIT